MQLSSIGKRGFLLNRLNISKHLTLHSFHNKEQRGEKEGKQRVVGSPDIVGYLNKLASKPVLLRRPVYRSIF